MLYDAAQALRRLGRNLVAHQADSLSTWANEDETRGFDTLGKIGIFREKTVAGMNCLGIGNFSGRNNRRHVQITQRRRCRANTNRLIGELDVFCFAISLGMDDDRLDAEFATGALNTQRDLAPVSN